MADPIDPARWFAAMRASCEVYVLPPLLELPPANGLGKVGKKTCVRFTEAFSSTQGRPKWARHHESQLRRERLLLLACEQQRQLDEKKRRLEVYALCHRL